MNNPHRRSGITMLIIAWVLIFALLFWFFAGWETRENNPNSEAVLSAQTGEVVLQRNRSGHYVADGKINGVNVTFLVDTGATQIALSAELAHELDLDLNHRVTVTTANGVASGYATRLRTVSLGPITLRDVGAVVTSGIDGETVLLGMSFLQRLEFTQRAGQLILRPAAKL
ncbi:MAG: retropepsin-like aspartic protease family protein [Burkholderiales bacterium]